MNVYTVLLEHVERVKTFGHVCTFEKDLGQKKVFFFFFFSHFCFKVRSVAT